MPASFESFTTYRLLATSLHSCQVRSSAANWMPAVDFGKSPGWRIMPVHHIHHSIWSFLFQHKAFWNLQCFWTLPEANEQLPGGTGRCVVLDWRYHHLWPRPEGAHWAPTCNFEVHWDCQGHSQQEVQVQLHQSQISWPCGQCWGGFPDLSSGSHSKHATTHHHHQATQVHGSGEWAREVHTTHRWALSTAEGTPYQESNLDLHTQPSQSIP